MCFEYLNLTGGEQFIKSEKKTTNTNETNKKSNWNQWVECNEPNKNLKKNLVNMELLKSDQTVFNGLGNFEAVLKDQMKELPFNFYYWKNC